MVRTIQVNCLNTSAIAFGIGAAPLHARIPMDRSMPHRRRLDNRPTMLPVHAPFVWALQSRSSAMSLAQWCSMGSQALTTTSRQTQEAPSPGSPHGHTFHLPHHATLALHAGSRVPLARASLAVKLLEHSSDLLDFTARWNLLNEAIASHHATQLEWDGASALRLRHAFRSNGTLAPSHWFVAGAVGSGLSYLGAQASIAGLRIAYGSVSDGEFLEQCNDDLVIELENACPRSRAALTEAPDVPANAPATLFPVLQALQQEPGDAWTLAMAAARAGMSSRSLQRVLAAEGVTWPQVVRAFRVQVASSMILDRDTSLTRIAHTVGFSDSAHLSRCFHAAAGLSPSTYRAIAHGRSRWRGVAA